MNMADLMEVFEIDDDDSSGEGEDDADDSEVEVVADPGADVVCVD